MKEEPLCRYCKPGAFHSTEEHMAEYWPKWVQEVVNELRKENQELRGKIDSLEDVDCWPWD